MTRVIAIAVGAGLVGVLVGFLWWGTAARRTQEDLRALQGERAAAEAAREELKGVQTKLKKTEEELQSERERRSRLEAIVSEGRK